jgi:ADP-heptose:LPS heptosyltransferase
MAGTVLLRRGALGDVVLLGAVTTSLERPVTVLTAPSLVGLVARMRGVDVALPWPKDASARAIAATLPRGARVIDLHATTRSRLVAAWAGGAASRVDKRSLHRRLWLRGFVATGRPPVPALYAQACDVAVTPPPWFDLPAAQRDALILVPGAAWPTKRWATDRLATVGRAWAGPVVVLGGPDDDAICADVARAVPGAEVLVERGFDRTLRALASAAVAVGGDTGLVHLAAACGAPVVTLFGPTHPADGFAVHRGVVVQRALPCRPCTLHGRPACPLGHHACMDLAAAEVIAAARAAAGAG